MELTLENFQKECATLQSSMETRVKELLLSSSDESKKKVEALNTDIAQLKTAVDNMEKQQRQAKAAGIPGYSDTNEHKKFSITSFVGALYKEAYTGADGHRNPWKGAEFEKEACEAYQKRLTQERIEGIVARDNNAGDGNLGGYLIPPDQTNEIIELAIANMPIMKMGTTIIRGLVGDLPVPNVLARPTSYWVGETEAPTESSASYGMKYLRPRKLGAFTKQSNRLIYQSRGVSDQIIKQLLSESIALKLEEGLISGTGTDKQPLGLQNTTGMTTSSVSLGTNGGRFRIDDAGKMIADLDDVNELSMPGTFGFLMNPRVKNGMKRERSPQYSGQAVNQGLPILWMNPLLNDKVLQDLIGYNIGSTSLVPKNVTTGSSNTTSKVIFGNFTKFWVSFWRDFVIKVSDQAADGSGGSAFLQDQMFIVAFQEVDSLLMRPSAMTMAAGAETTESLW